MSRPSARGSKTRPTPRPGLVICHYGARVEVEDEHGVTHRCTLLSRVDPVVCGDRVGWVPTQGKEGVIVERGPRRSVLRRPDHRGRLRAVAANVDRLLLMVAARPPDGREASGMASARLDEDLINRYLVAAELSDISPVIVANKMDLLDAAGTAALQRTLSLYTAIGYEVFPISAKTGTGMDALEHFLGRGTGVVVGQSGVGKSSLVKALLPAAAIAIAADTPASESGPGRHTTTRATLYHLPQGGSLIDSPGVRAFALWHVEPREVARGFVEFRRLAGACRFNDCLHLGEPGCAVRQALQDGGVDPRRMDSYRRILQELEEGPGSG